MRSGTTTFFPSFNLDPQAAAQWDSMVGGAEVNLSTRMLRSVERNLMKTPLYVMRQGTDETINASVVGYLLDDSQQGSADNLSRLSRIDSLLASIGRDDIAPNDFRRLLPSLSCGGWTLSHSNILFSEELTQPDRMEVGSEILRVLTSAAGDVGARSLSFPYVSERNEGLRELLLREGFIEFPSSSHFTINVTWASFGEYLEHFPRKKRGNIRREYQMLRNAGIRFRIAPLDESLARILLPLAYGTSEKYQSSMGMDHLYERLLLVVEFGSEVILVEQDNALTGFGVILQWRDHLYSRMVGFDYQSQRKVPLYFGVMYEHINCAIERGLGKIEYSTTGGAAKKSRGAREYHQYGYVKAVDSADAEYISDMIRAGDESSSAGCHSSPPASSTT